MRKLGTMIRKKRIAAGLTQAEMAEMCAVDIRTVRRLEKCAEEVSLDTVNRVADALHLRGHYDPALEKRLIYCAPNGKRHIHDLRTLLIILPLINRHRLCDLLITLEGDYNGYEVYANETLNKLWKAVPDSPARRQAEKYISFVPPFKTTHRYVFSNADHYTAYEQCLTQLYTDIKRKQMTLDAKRIIQQERHKYKVLF